MELTNNAAHGKDFQSDLFDALNMQAVSGGIAHVQKDYGIRHPGYGNAKQYYAPLVVTFRNGEKWAIFSTTSCRTDRIKGQQWDADHIKMLDPMVVRVYLVYPDEATAKDKNAFVAQQRKFDTNWEFSRIDRILPFSELMEKLRHGSRGSEDRA